MRVFWSTMAIRVHKSLHKRLPSKETKQMRHSSTIWCSSLVDRKRSFISETSMYGASPNFAKHTSDSFVHGARVSDCTDITHVPVSARCSPNGLTWNLGLQLGLKRKAWAAPPGQCQKLAAISSIASMRVHLTASLSLVLRHTSECGL